MFPLHHYHQNPPTMQCRSATAVSHFEKANSSGNIYLVMNLSNKTNILKNFICYKSPRNKSEGYRQMYNPSENMKTCFHFET